MPAQGSLALRVAALARDAERVKVVVLEVTAPFAEVRAGTELIAKARRKQLLLFTKKKDGYYLVSVNGKKGWIAETDVRPVEITVKTDAGAEPPAKAPPKAEKLPPGTLVSPDGTLHVALGADGSVTARTSTQDLGTGQRTVTAIVVAEVLGLEPRAPQITLLFGESPFGARMMPARSAHSATSS